MNTQYGVRRSIAFDEALAFVEAAEQAEAQLEDLYNQDRRDSQRVASTHHRLGVALKLAEVQATLAVAEEIRAVRTVLAEGESWGQAWIARERADEPIPFSPAGDDRDLVDVVDLDRERQP
ncbi:MAG TPA: hypothetical protein VGD43_25020 [Micromonospora sp.]